jgi:hypothetical protein
LKIIIYLVVWCGLRKWEHQIRGEVSPGPGFHITCLFDKGGRSFWSRWGCNGDGDGPDFINPSVYYQTVRISKKVAVIMRIMMVTGEKWDSLKTTLPFETTGRFIVTPSRIKALEFSL